MTNEILIIDDNLDIRQLVSGILMDQGFRIREAANFDQALLEINKRFEVPLSKILFLLIIPISDLELFILDK